MTKDEKWMKVAINEAKLAMKENEIPVGSVLVLNEKIIAKAHNQPIGNNDPTAHSEIQLLRKAGKQKENYRLVGSTLYVTLEPCVMCFGAMIHARIERIVFGASDPKTGVCGHKRLFLGLMHQTRFSQYEHESLHQNTLHMARALHTEWSQLIYNFLFACQLF